MKSVKGWIVYCTSDIYTKRKAVKRARILYRIKLAVFLVDDEWRCRLRTTENESRETAPNTRWVRLLYNAFSGIQTKSTTGVICTKYSWPIRKWRNCARRVWCGNVHGLAFRNSAGSVNSYNPITGTIFVCRYMLWACILLMQIIYCAKQASAAWRCVFLHVLQTEYPQRRSRSYSFLITFFSENVIWY